MEATFPIYLRCFRANSKSCPHPPTFIQSQARHVEGGMHLVSSSFVFFSGKERNTLQQPFAKATRHRACSYKSGEAVFAAREILS